MAPREGDIRLEGRVVTEPGRTSPPAGYVIEHARAAGFVLAGRSEINAHPRDPHDHPNGVWSLPPTYRDGDADRARFAAIGESDRMTLRFVKP